MPRVLFPRSDSHDIISLFPGVHESAWTRGARAPGLGLERAAFSAIVAPPGNGERLIRMSDARGAPASFDMTTPSTPPVFQPVVVGIEADPFAEACRAAAAGAEVGTFLYSPREDRADCAVVLGPEEPLAQSLLVAYVTMLGTGDALGALVSPAVAVLYGWPDRITVNGGLAGGIRVAAGAAEASDAPPPWMVVGVTVEVSREGARRESGHDIGRTTLHEEGCGEIRARDLLEHFSRSFLNWINRWQEEGFGPVRAAWLFRATGNEEEAEFEVAGACHWGRIESLDDAGGLHIDSAGVTLDFGLEDALASPTWVR